MLYDTTPTVVKLTKAQYDALDSADKNNDTIYFITDVNGDGQSFQPVIYSTEEREIGVWTDGKPLYEKTCIFNPVALSNGTTIAHGISNVDTIVWVDSSMTRSNNRTITFPYGSGYDKCSGFYADRTNLTFTGGDTWQLVDYSQLCATLRYTKTTDTPGSGTWTPQGVPAVHYSEEEQVIGTWIDGKTLYEKTFKFDNVSIDTSHETELADLTGLNIETWVGVVHSAGYLQVYNITVDENRLSIGYKPTSKKLVGGQSYTQQYTAVDILTTIRYTKSST